MKLAFGAKCQVRMRGLARKIYQCHRKRSDFRNNRWIFLFSNLQKLWWGVFWKIRCYRDLMTKWALYPRWKKFGWFTGNFKLIYPQFQVRHVRRQRYWQKLRKRWIWHRLIKRSVKVRFLSNLKKYFAYNIAVRKYFKKILPSYNLHKKVMYQQVPYFLVQMGLVPVLKQAVKLCKAKRVSVNGFSVGPDYIMKPFDVVRFNFSKRAVWRKHRWHTNRFRQWKGIKLRRGLIYHRKMRMYIFYKNLDQVPGRRRLTYLFYYYFYRNLLQTCRTR